MPKEIYHCNGGTVVLPEMVLCDRRDGGHLVVNPPRTVSERSDLSPLQIAQWGLLVAATGRAMLEVLPHLQGGCLNYWEAGNWALNDAALPVGPKSVRECRSVHLHILGRSRNASHPDWRWGESPKFPDFASSKAWAANFVPLSASECAAVVLCLDALLADRYRLPPEVDESGEGICG